MLLLLLQSLNTFLALQRRFLSTMTGDPDTARAAQRCHPLQLLVELGLLYTFFPIGNFQTSTFLRDIHFYVEGLLWMCF